MIFINEWFPNPAGADAVGEFVELYNSGFAAVDLGGWRLQTENGKKYSLDGKKISAGGYLTLARAQTKLTLRNTDGALALYDAAGALIDRGTFYGSAPEEKSFSRADHEPLAAESSGVTHFAFAAPTLGTKNATFDAAVAVREYARGIPLNHPLDTSGFFAIMMGTAAALSGLLLYVAKNHEDLSKLFFG